MTPMESLLLALAECWQVRALLTEQVAALQKENAELKKQVETIADPS